MSPRPRKVSDDEIFAAIFRVMMRVKPVDLTLAAVGREAGITPSALVQRFGSRAGMMRALNAKFAEGTPDMLGGVRAAHASPLAALFAYAECFASMAESAATLAHHLAYLEQDLSDPEMYEHVSAHTRSTRAALQRWVEEAISAGELSPSSDAAALSRIVHTTVTGSMMSFAFFREGTPAEWLRDDLALALRPYVVPK